MVVQRMIRRTLIVFLEPTSQRIGCEDLSFVLPRGDEACFELPAYMMPEYDMMVMGV